MSSFFLESRVMLCMLTLYFKRGTLYKFIEIHSVLFCFVIICVRVTLSFLYSNLKCSVKWNNMNWHKSYIKSGPGRSNLFRFVLHLCIICIQCMYFCLTSLDLKKKKTRPDCRYTLISEKEEGMAMKGLSK